MKTKNIQLFLLGLVFVLSILAFYLKQNQKFYLEDTYYNDNSMEEINHEKLNALMDSKESFVVFIYQTMCTNSEEFEKVLKEFQKENRIKIYKMSFSDILETNLKKTIKYYPSFLIYKKGKLMDYLEADKDKHTKYYKSQDEFTKWFTKYVLLKEIEVEEKTNTSISELEEKYIQDIKLEDIKQDKEKVNIYFFWGNGCPHCADEISFFENLEEKYKEIIQIYPFEVWKNKENSEIMKTFGAAMEDTVTGVPYTIIGNKTFIGFGGNRGEYLKSAIEEAQKNKFDVYFDKIKKS